MCMTTIQADALGLYGWSILGAKASGEMFSFCHLASPIVIASISPFVIASEAKQSLLDPIRHTLN